MVIRLDIDFISSRGVIKSILSSPYIEHEELIICATKYRGTIYLCKFYTDEKEHYHVTATTLEKQITSWGFKFEQYMVAGISLKYVYKKLITYLFYFKYITNEMSVEFI